jgi:hypothetical protein
MSWQDKVGAGFGVLFIALGLAYLFSPRFGAIALAFTSQGEMWKGLLGEKWAPVVTRYVFSLASIALGVFVIYSAVTGS